MRKVVVTVLIILDILACTFLFFTYGPIDYFRNLLVTTAMTTKSHHYLAKTLYSDETIYKIMDSNYMEEVDENTDLTAINISKINEQTSYDSIYEEQILSRKKEDVYKIIPLSGTGYQGYLVAIYDPSRIQLVTSNYLGTRGEFLESMAKRENALIAINAGGFADAGGVGNGGIPTGTLIKNVKILYQGVDTGWGGGIVGFTKDNILMLYKGSAEGAIQAGIENAVEFGPFLIVNGKRSIAKGNGGYGISSRTAIGQRKDGIVLFVVIDGRQPGYSLGVSMSELTDIFVRYRAYNAVNLDGGASSSLVENGNLISKPCAISATGERWIPSAWMVK